MEKFRVYPSDKSLVATWDWDSTKPSETVMRLDEISSRLKIVEEKLARTHEESAPDSEAALGEPEGDVQETVREVVRNTFGEWEIRCNPDGTECFLYQLAYDSEKNPVAEFSLLRLPSGSDAAAGVTIVTPLGTLLPRGVVLQIDDGEARQYEFNWCSKVGCFSRFGLTVESLDHMKDGEKVRIILYSTASPDRPVHLALDLRGFDQAFDNL